jgi:uncharacterized membrane protein YqjE
VASSARTGTTAGAAGSPTTPGTPTPQGATPTPGGTAAPGGGTASSGARPTRQTVTFGERLRGKSAGQLMKEVSEDFSALFRKEVELAKLEVGRAVSTKLKGAILGAIAASFGLFALIFLLLGLRDGLDTFLWRWVADLLTAAILILVGAIVVLVAKRMLTTPVETDMTKQSIREDVEWAKTLGKS